ncbi:MAG: DUF1902 domain-containing protein [Symbiobacteriaceae bacterium]|nr:DUF1902 domain-containing protein [Symbiobacteriaceae bacterium]
MHLHSLNTVVDTAIKVFYSWATGNNSKGAGDMEHIIQVSWDYEAHVWYAICDSIPIALNDVSFDTLIDRVRLAAPEMLALNGILKPDDRLLIRAERRERIA